MPPSAKGKRTDDNKSDLVACGNDPFAFERECRRDGHRLIAGIDEAGRGPLAGPVVAAAVILPENVRIDGVTDSKLLTERQRERLFPLILDAAVSVGIGSADERTIDDVNIYQATILAMERAVALLDPPPDYLLIDAMILTRVSCGQKALIKGDVRSHSIAAASILAKVTRDRIMHELHEQYPQYNFRKHKGYGTREHLDLLRKHGPCPAHRRSFAPVAGLWKGKTE